MRKIQLRSVVVIFLAVSLAFFGVLINTPAANTAPGDARLVVSLGNLTTGRSGEFYEYDVRVSNNGADASNVTVSFDLAPGSHDISIVNADAACQEYEYKANGAHSGDIAIGNPVNCFNGTPAIAHGAEGDSDQANVTAVISSIKTLRSYRFKVRARMPFHSTTAQLNLRAFLRGIQNNEGSENIITVSQSVDTSNRYKTRILSSLTPLTLGTPLSLGDRNQISANTSVLEYEATWENKGPYTARNLVLDTFFSIYYDGWGGDSWDELVNSAFRTVATCDPTKSSPGVCDRIQLPTEYVVRNRSTSALDRTNPTISKLATGEKIVLKIRGQVYGSCLPTRNTGYIVRASAYALSGAGNLDLSASTAASKVTVANLAPAPCPQATLKVTSSLPQNGTPQGPDNVTNYILKFENTSQVDINDYEFSNTFELNPSRHNDRITADITLTCSSSTPGLCPAEKFNYSIKNMSFARDLIARDFRNVDIPAGQSITLDFAVRYKFSSCLDAESANGQAIPKGQPVLLKVTHAELSPYNAATSDGAVVVLSHDSIRSVKHDLTGGVSCGETKPTLRVSADWDREAIGWGQSRTYTFTVENLSNIPANDIKLEINLDPGPNPNRPGNAGLSYQILTPLNGPEPTSSGGNSVSLINRYTSSGISIPAKDPTNPEANKRSFNVTVFYDALQLKLRQPISCPTVGDRSTPGAYGAGLTLDPYNNAAFGYANYKLLPLVLPKKKQLIYCNDVTGSIQLSSSTGLGSQIGPDQPLAVKASFQNNLGYAPQSPYEIRLPEGSIVFPEDVLNKELIEGGQHVVPGLLSCNTSFRNGCNRLTARLTKETISGRKYYILKGSLPLSTPASKLDLTLNGRSGVIGNDRVGYKASVITMPDGDLVTSGNDPETGLNNNTYNLSNSTWKIANQQVQYGIHHQVTVEGATNAQLPQLDFAAELECTSSYAETPAAVTVPAGQTSGAQVNAGKQWLKDKCTLTATAPEAPAGYVWKNANAPAGTSQFATSYAQDSKYTVATDSPYTYRFNWTLVPDPRVDLPQPVAVDPCGLDNAHWELPADSANYSWNLSGDGALTATALNKALFAPDFAATKTFPKPADSGLLCPTIKLKVRGERVANSDHQFALNWLQPAAQNGDTQVAAATNIPASETAFEASSGTIDLNAGQAATLTLRTTPGEAARAYARTLTCTDTAPDAANANLTVPATAQTLATGETSWNVTLPASVKQVECAVQIQPALSKVTVVAKDGGYPGQPSTQAVALDGSAWSLFPAVNGVIDTAHPIRMAQVPGQTGQFEATDLLEGTYYLYRVTTPAGYEASQLTGTGTPAADAVKAITIADVPYLQVRLQAGQPLTVETTTLRQFGTFTLEKVSGTNGELLAGSAWEITEILAGNAPGEVRQVSDCVADSEGGCATALDRDHAAGRIQVKGLPWGTYRLVETKAPAGYRLPEAASSAKTFTVGATSLSPAFTGAEAIKNDYASIPDIPHTGGLGREHLLIAGVAVLLLAGAATVLLHRKAQHI
ncbi:MAG: SpaA isopeptide-forming pilin-related protein [Actinomycetaceae bacterium]|nr:SpaA isopeptide-forming pilin-related protein [Actinomycetaceae bacterium]